MAHCSSPPKNGSYTTSRSLLCVHFFEEDQIWVSLWSEGLATYVSEVLNPDVGIKELMLDTPPGMYAACKRSLPAILATLQSKLESEDDADYEKFFLMSSEDKTIPKRAGYYAGYLVARKIGEKWTLVELAKLTEAEIKTEIRAALQALAKALN